MDTRSNLLILLALAAAGCEVSVDVDPMMKMPPVAGSPAPDPVRPPAIGGGQAPKPTKPNPEPNQNPTPTPTPTPTPDPAPKPAKKPLPDADLYAFERSPEPLKFVVHGKSVGGSTVTLYQLGSGCSTKLARQITKANGEVSIDLTDFHAEDERGFEARVSKQGSADSSCKAYPDFFAKAEERNAAPTQPNLLATDPASGSDANDLTLSFETSPGIENVLVFNNSTDCSGLPFAEIDDPQAVDGVYHVPFHVVDNSTNQLTVVAEKHGKRSACSNVVEYVEQSAVPEPPQAPTVGRIYPEPKSLYGYQIPGQAAPGDVIKFFEFPDCSGRDFTRIVSTFVTGAFTAWIDVPPHSDIPALGFQVTRGDLVMCEELPADINTSAWNLLSFDPVQRTRLHDASLDMVVSGTGRGGRIEAYLDDNCGGSGRPAVAESEISDVLPFAWSVTFNYDRFISKYASFRVTGTSDGARMEEPMCIITQHLFEMPTSNELPIAAVSVAAEKADALTFLVAVDRGAEDANYYVNLARDENCSDLVFRGAVKADYSVDLPKDTNQLYSYTESEDFQRSPCTKVY
jgi:hypothetical protein